MDTCLLQHAEYGLAVFAPLALSFPLWKLLFLLAGTLAIVVIYIASSKNVKKEIEETKSSPKTRAYMASQLKQRMKAGSRPEKAGKKRKGEPRGPERPKRAVESGEDDDFWNRIATEHDGPSFEVEK